MKILKIVFCVLSCLCVAASVFLGAFLGWGWFFLAVGAAVLFGAAMFFIKKKSDPVERKTDFMNSPEENAEILEENTMQKKD